MKFSIDNAVQILERTPKVLTTMLEGISKDWINSNEGENTWSPYDIIGHLIHGEKTDWIPRVQIIISEESNKNFEAFDRFAQFEASKGKTITHLLMNFQN